MKKTGRVLTFIILLLVSGSVLFAASISITASLDKNEIYIDDTVNLTIKVNGSIGSLPDPNVDSLNKDFDIVGTSTSTSISVINGSFQAEKDVVLQLKPLHAGTITIKNIYVEVGGTRYYINPLKLKVINTYQLPATGSVGGKNSYNYTSPLTSYTIPPSVLNLGIGVEGKVTKRKVYVGEEFIYRFIFYNSRGLFGNPQYSPPQFKGVWKYDLLKEPISKKIYAKGTLFQVQELRTAIIPLSAGRLVIPSAKLIAPLDFFSGNKVFRTRPIIVNVYPLPSTGQPGCFTGAVGDGYRIKLKTKKLEVKVGAPVQISMEIIGPGNLNLSAPPPVTANTKSFKFFKPQVNDSIITTPNGIIVDRNITYIFQALKAGKYKIGPIYFCYFSPVTGSYKKVKVGSVEVIVNKGAIVAKHIEKRKIVLRPPIKKYVVVNYPGKVTAYLMAFWKLKWPGFLVLAILAIVGFLIGRLKKVVKESKEEREKKKRLRKLEKQLKKLVMSDNIEEFYEEWKKYFKERWGLNVDVMEGEELKKLLQEGVPEEITDIVSKITIALHRYLFAGEQLPSEWKRDVLEFLKRAGI